MKLVFEFENYQAETSVKLSSIEIQKKINTAMQEDWLTSSAIFVFIAA